MGKESTVKRRWIRYSWILGALLPPALIVILIYRYAFDVPYMDSWEMVPLLYKAYTHTLHFSDLWEPHNGHRIFFGRILMLIMARFTNWNVRAEVVTNFLCATVIFLLFLELWRQSVRKFDVAFFSFEKNLYAVPALSLFLFSPVAYRAWLWGWMLHLFLCLLAVAVVIFLLARFPLSPFNMAGAIMATTVAVFSFASGLLLVLVWLLRVLISLSKKDRLNALTGFIFSLGLVFIFFFHVQNTGNHSLLQSISSTPKILPVYWACYMGSPVVSWNVYIASCVGIMGTGLFFFISARLVQRRVPITILFPYWALGIFSLGNACLTALARSGEGLSQALSSRYVPVTSFFWIGLCCLLSFPSVQRKKLSKTYQFTLVLLISLVAISSMISIYKADERWDAVQLGRRALFGEEPEKDLRQLYPFPSILETREAILRRYHLSIFKR